MLVLVVAFVCVFIIILVLLFYNVKRDFKNKTTNANCHKSHFKFSISKHFYIEFDDESNNTNNKDNTSNT